MSAKKVLKMIEENDVKFVDFRFCDTRGKEQHVTFPAHSIDEDTFEVTCLMVLQSPAGNISMNQT